MTDREINVVIGRMVDLLRFSDSDRWSRILQRLGDRILAAPDDTKREILALFGGMGSLTDLVLYKHGSVLLAENDEFDKLRARLFDLCHKG